MSQNKDTIRLSKLQKSLLKMMQSGITCGCTGYTSDNKYKFRGPVVESLATKGLIQPIKGHLFTYEISEKGKSINLEGGKQHE